MENLWRDNISVSRSGDASFLCKQTESVLRLCTCMVMRSSASGWRWFASNPQVSSRRCRKRFTIVYRTVATNCSYVVVAKTDLISVHIAADVFHSERRWLRDGFVCSQTIACSRPCCILADQRSFAVVTTLADLQLPLHHVSPLQGYSVV